MQTLARKNEWPLDKVNLTVDVTKKFKEEFNQPAREGAYVYGLYMEGRQTPQLLGVIDGPLLFLPPLGSLPICTDAVWLNWWLKVSHMCEFEDVFTPTSFDHWDFRFDLERLHPDQTERWIQFTLGVIFYWIFLLDSLDLRTNSSYIRLPSTVNKIIPTFQPHPLFLFTFEFSLGGFTALMVTQAVTLTISRDTYPCKKRGDFSLVYCHILPNKLYRALAKL